MRVLVPVLFLFLSGLSGAPGEIASADLLARSLEARGQFESAAVEWQRVEASVEGALRDEARRGAFRCLLRVPRLPEARTLIQVGDPDASWLRLARVRLDLAGGRDAARHAAGVDPGEGADVRRRREATVLAELARAQISPRAFLSPRSFAREKDAEFSMDLVEAVRITNASPFRSPFAYGLLALVPGLGHLALGLPREALAAFAWNALAGGAAAVALAVDLGQSPSAPGRFVAPAILGSLFAFTWAANVAGSALQADRLNRSDERKMRLRLAAGLEALSLRWNLDL